MYNNTSPSWCLARLCKYNDIVAFAVWWTWNEDKVPSELQHVVSDNDNHRNVCVVFLKYEFIIFAGN